MPCGDWVMEDIDWVVAKMVAAREEAVAESKDNCDPQYDRGFIDGLDFVMALLAEKGLTYIG